MTAAHVGCHFIIIVFHQNRKILRAPPPLSERAAKRSRRGRECFPAEKTVAGARRRIIKIESESLESRCVLFIFKDTEPSSIPYRTHSESRSDQLGTVESLNQNQIFKKMAFKMSAPLRPTSRRMRGCVVMLWQSRVLWVRLVL